MPPRRNCPKCIARKPNGQRCGNTTCKGQYCWVHLKHRHGFRIKPSNIGPGDGLFWVGHKTQQVLNDDTRIPNLQYKGKAKTRLRVNMEY